MHRAGHRVIGAPDTGEGGDRDDMLAADDARDVVIIAAAVRIASPRVRGHLLPFQEPEYS